MKVEELARSGGRESVIRSDEDPDALSKEAERFFDRVVEQYAGIAGKSGKLGEAAEKELFRLRQLAVGRPAPDVEGEDVDGKRFRLSDYRGKVVVLTFSGNWCGPCRAMYPHERNLVERMKGRPFELLSVNTDEDKATLRKFTRLWRDHLALLVGGGPGAAELRPMATGLFPDGLCH